MKTRRQNAPKQTTGFPRENPETEGMIDKTLKQRDILAARQKTYLAMAAGYQPGAIVIEIWGWEQTNVDFYRIEKRAEQWVTLTAVSSRITETGFMSGTTVPLDEPKTPHRHLRKKLKFRDGKPAGFANWPGGLWNAKPVRCSWDA